MRFVWIAILSFIIFFEPSTLYAQENDKIHPPIEKKLQRSKNIIQENRTHRQNLKEMTAEERKEYMELQRTRWSGLSEQQKEQYRTKMVDRWSKLPPEVRQRRKNRFKNMDDDRKEIFKDRHPRIYDDLISSE